MDKVMDRKEVFFKLLFGRSEGYLSLAFLEQESRKFFERYYRYPKELDTAIKEIDALKDSHNAYFCPQLFSEKARKKEFVNFTPNAWADLDSCHPNKMLVTPSVQVQSSPGRYQAYWVFDDFVAPKEAEELSRRIAYFHHDDGADNSGWDLTQLLRVPFTPNHKYKNTEVTTIEVSKAKYRMDDFVEYPQLAEFKTEELDMPDISGIDVQELLDSHARSMNPQIFKYLEETPKDGAWSAALWNLEMLLFETGFNRAQVFAIVQNAACNKYERDKRPVSQLWKDVCRAGDHHDLNKKLMVEKPHEMVTLLSQDERDYVDTLPPTFVDRYIDWAAGLSDASKQYHQAGGFIILSSLLCGSVALPTSFGVIIPNLWFMILADTTLTRKSTAMDIATDLLEEVNSDAIMATDGTIEGLMTALSTRARKPSLFLRDEFSGLIDSMLKKDYMAGMAEMLTKLYDGRMMKRVLKKEIFEIHDPRLIIFAGGIKNKIVSQLTFEHVSSGFLPRFVFITAESDITKVRPLGPPEFVVSKERALLLDEMREMYDHYQAPQTLSIGETSMSFDAARTYDAKLTSEAWIRYNKLEYTLTQLGVTSEMPDVFTPVGDRLAKSILKAAILIAASRQRNQHVEVTLDDVLIAIKYGEAWRTYSTEIIANVGRSQNEKLLQDIEKHIRRSPDGMPRSKILRVFKLTARQGREVIDTMIDRGLIEEHRNGRTSTYYAF